MSERWPGYTEQSWSERFAELDRRHTAMMKDIMDKVWATTTPPPASLHPEPIEDDREAAARLINPNVEGIFKADDLRSGKWDSHPYVQAFMRHRLAFSTSAANDDGKLPADVVALVVAAREALEEGFAIASAADKLDRALEAFASRVCYDDEGGTLPEAHADPCTCADQAGKGGHNLEPIDTVPGEGSL